MIRSMTPSPEEPDPQIEVCICTFRRTSLALTLASLARQTGLRERFRIIVADNDHAPSAIGQVQAARGLGLDIVYIHAPAQNISLARNACLDAASARFVAWIDDDEVADERWLASLMKVMRTTGADAAFGPVVAVYPASAPAWATQADLHSTEPVRTSRGVDTGYTSNAMVLRSSIVDHRFDLSLGRSGGEDTDFFTRLHAQGRRFVAAPEAQVSEPVGPERLHLDWLVKRAFRSGQTHARRFLGTPAGRARALPKTATKALVCVAMATLAVDSPARWRKSLVRAALHAGATARLLGWKERWLY